jgi:hypothetical protein
MKGCRCARRSHGAGTRSPLVRQRGSLGCLGSSRRASHSGHRSVGTAAPSGPKPPTKSVRPARREQGTDHARHDRAHEQARRPRHHLRCRWRTCHRPPPPSVKPLVRLPRLSRLVTAYGRKRPLGFREEVLPRPPTPRLVIHSRRPRPASRPTGMAGWAEETHRRKTRSWGPG